MSCGSRCGCDTCIGKAMGSSPWPGIDPACLPWGLGLASPSGDRGLQATAGEPPPPGPLHGAAHLRDRADTLAERRSVVSHDVTIASPRQFVGNPEVKPHFDIFGWAEWIGHRHPWAPLDGPNWGAEHPFLGPAALPVQDWEEWGLEPNWNLLPDSACPPASTGCEEGEECPPVGDEREIICDLRADAGPFVVLEMGGVEDQLMGEILANSGCLLWQNWDLAEWAFRVVLGSDALLLPCVADGPYYLVPMADGLSDVLNLLVGNVGTMTIDVCDSVAMSPFGSSAWLDVLLGLAGVPLTHSGTSGVTFFCEDNLTNQKYMDLWPGAADQIKLCVAIDVAATILHEMLHACGFVGFEGAKVCDVSIRGTYLIENTFKWAMFQRYSSALQATCCREAYAPSGHLSDDLFMDKNTRWIDQPC